MGLTLAPKAEAARCYKFRGEGYWLSKDGGMTRTQGLNTRSLDRVGIAGGWTKVDAGGPAVRCSQWFVKHKCVVWTRSCVGR